jgi:hypothetical protein
LIDFIGSEPSLFIAQYANEAQRKSDRPLIELYNVVHAYCLSLIVAIVNSQAEGMRKRQKNAVMLRKVEYVKDPLSLTIKYWQLSPTEGSETVPTTPSNDRRTPLSIVFLFFFYLVSSNGFFVADFYVRVFADENTNLLQVKHVPDLIDAHHEIAHFTIDPSSIDLEGILVAVANTNALARLRVLQQFLIASAQIKPSILHNGKV